MYAVKKPSRAMQAMLAGLVNMVTYVNGMEQKTNNIQQCRHRDEQHVAQRNEPQNGDDQYARFVEPYIRDFLNIKFIGTIMLMIFGCWCFYDIEYVNVILLNLMLNQLLMDLQLKP